MAGKVNWGYINALKVKRYNNATSQMKTHIKEEQELAKKIRILEQFMDYTNGPCLKLYSGVYADPSILRVFEMGLEAQWGFKVKLIKYPGVRFEKLPTCPDILPQTIIQLPVNEERLALIKALHAVKGKHHLAAAQLEDILNKDKTHD